MYPILVTLVFAVPSAVASVDCRAACHACRASEDPRQMLEIYCAMCQECKARRKDRLKSKIDLIMRENPTAAAEQITIADEMHNDDLENTADIVQDIPEGCPTPEVCSDEEYLEDVPSTSRTVKTTTTTRRPCPPIKPCKKKKKKSTTTTPCPFLSPPICPFLPPPPWPYPPPPPCLFQPPQQPQICPLPPLSYPLLQTVLPFGQPAIYPFPPPPQPWQSPSTAPPTVQSPFTSPPIVQSPSTSPPTVQSPSTSPPTVGTAAIATSTPPALLRTHILSGLELVSPLPGASAMFLSRLRQQKKKDADYLYMFVGMPKNIV